MKSLKILGIIIYIIGAFTNNIYSFSVEPGRIYQKVKLNKQTQGEYTIINNEALSVKIIVEKTDNAKWFRIKRSEFILKPGESRNIKYSILVKENKGKGELRSGITVTQKVLNKQKLKNQGASFKSRTRLPVYVVIEDSYNIDYNITKIDFNGSFSKIKKSINGKITAKLGIQNSGNVHFIAEPRIIIYKLENGVKKIYLGEQEKLMTYLVFPEKIKEIDLEYPGTFEPGEYIVRLFCYFKFDDDLEVTHIKTLKKERCFNVTKRVLIDQNGDFKVID